MKFAVQLVAAAAVLACAQGAFAQQGQTVKMVRIDAQTGLL